MSYSRDIIAAADSAIASRKQKAEALQVQRMSEVLMNVPGFYELQKKLAATMVDAVKSVGMGSNAGDFMKSLAEKNLSIQAEMADLLEKNGYSRDYINTDYTCKACNDTGYVDAMPCFCRTSLIKELAIKKLCETAPADRCTFDSFKEEYYSDEPDSQMKKSPRARMSGVYEFCKAYAEDFDLCSESLYFYGATGLGKTHLAAAIAGEAVKKGYNVIYDSASNLLRRLEKEHFSSKDNRYEGAQDEMIGCNLLVIDDLGSEFPTSFTVSAVYNIINSRINNGLPTIITSNLDARGLEEKYTERVASRVFGTYRPIYFIGNDIRQLKK